MKTRIDLDALLAETVGEVTLFGRVLQVRAMDGAGYHLVAQVGANQVLGDASDVYALAQRLLVPPPSDEEMARLTPRALAVIVDMASGDAKAVEAALPNSSTLATETPSSATSNENGDSANASDTPAAG